MLLVVARREVGGFFGQPTGYALVAAFVLLLGASCLVVDDLLLGEVASLRRPFRWMSLWMLVLLPALTMRSFAEEFRTGTYAILGSLPLGPAALVVGKWLGQLALLGILLACTLPYPLALAALGPLDWGPVLGGYLGLLWMGGAYLAVGTAWSAAGESQVVAYLGTLATGLAFGTLGLLLPVLPLVLVPWVELLTFEHHYANLARGALDGRSLLFFPAFAAVALRTGVLLLQRRRLT